MTSSIASVDICNMALDMLSETSISSLDDDDPVALRLKRNFDQWRDLFLALHPWNFALCRIALPQDAKAPEYGWSRRYLLPGDCLRMLPLRMAGRFEGDLIEHELESNFILTDEPPPLRVRYIRRNEQYGTWSPEAINAFAGFLAARIAHATTGSLSVQDRAQANADELLLSARRLDGLQSEVEKPTYQSVIAVRNQ